MHDSTYRYTSFTLSTVLSDLRFGGGIAPGSSIGAIDLATADRHRFQWPRAGSPKLLLLVFGSRTCPATISTIPDLKTLHAEFGNQVEFVYLYVREAHPGNMISQPQTMEDKTAHACTLQLEYQIPWTIAVDTLDGEIHHLLAPRPNAVYLIDADGKVVFRTLFAADATALGRAIGEYLAGQSILRKERSPVIYPVLKLIGLTWEVVGSAGNTALRDLLLRTPFLYLPSRLAALMQGMSPFARGSVSMALSFVMIGLALWVAIQWMR